MGGFLIANASRRDPTRTAMIRNEYRKAMRRRFTALKRLVAATVVGNDALRLADPGSPLGILAARPARRYDFPSDPAGKANAFIDWLMDAADQDILEITRRDGRRIVSHTGWQNMYVRGAYGRGVQQADGQLKKAGVTIPEMTLQAVFNKPMHADLLAMLYARNFDELRGVTNAMGQGISRALAEGLARGLGPRQVAQIINGRVDGIGIYRATLISRTEIIRAHAESTLNRYEEFGVEGVSALVELSTAGDDKVCPVCQVLEGKTYSLKEARGIIPVHPNCRCAWLPVV